MSINVVDSSTNKLNVGWKLKRDPTKQIESRIQDELKALETLGEIPQQQRLKLSKSFTQPPRLYGLPKIHKENILCRPIVSSVGSPTYALAKKMARILSPFTGSSNSFVKYLEHFVQKIANTTLNRCDLLVSFDIKSLFTNVPVDEVVSRVAALMRTAVWRTNHHVTSNHSSPYS